jgi:hypothetical protein
MFKEKEDGKALHWSMTRVVAFIAAMTLNYALIVMSVHNHVHDIAWPFCVMYIVTLLAVPIMVLFKFLQALFASAPGKVLAKKVFDMLEVQASKIGVGGSSVPSSTVTSTTEVKNGDPDK